MGSKSAVWAKAVAAKARIVATEKRMLTVQEIQTYFFNVEKSNIKRSEGRTGTVF